MAEKELPRSWNKKLLPNFQVIAVDERDPDFPGGDPATNDRPNYPNPDKLLKDPSYIRFRRLELERTFHYTSRGNRTAINFLMTEGILEAIASTPSINDDSNNNARLTAIYKDYVRNPKALIAQLN